MSTEVLYCWCHSDSASVLLYFTLLIGILVFHKHVVPYVFFFCRCTEDLHKLAVSPFRKFLGIDESHTDLPKRHSLNSGSRVSKRMNYGLNDSVSGILFSLNFESAEERRERRRVVERYIYNVDTLSSSQWETHLEE